MGPVTIAVDSYGPVTDNAQSVYELSVIESIPNVEAEVKRDFGFSPDFEVANENLEDSVFGALLVIKIMAIDDARWLKLSINPAVAMFHPAGIPRHIKMKEVPAVRL